MSAFAGDLHTRTIQRVFGLGLSRTSANARPQRNLRPLIAETDAIIRDLQAIIFNLEQPGSAPDVQAAVLAVLRETFGLLAGIGAAALSRIRETARGFGGVVADTDTPGCLIEWRVPTPQ